MRTPRSGSSTAATWLTRLAGAVRAQLDAVKAFAGPDWEVAVVPPAARAILARFGATASHFERPEAIGG